MVRAVLVGQLILLFCGTAWSTTLLIDGGNAGAFQPEVRLLPTGKVLQPKTDGGVWRFNVDLAERLMLSVEIRVAPRPPTDTAFTPVAISIPFFEAGSVITVRAAPVPIRHGARLVRELYATDLVALSVEGIWDFYQRARSEAWMRIHRTQGNWDNLHPYDAQAVYKYLESVNALVVRSRFLPPSEVNEARDWLASAISQHLSIVKKGVAEKNVRKMILRVDANDAVRFTKVWEKIKNVPCSAREKLIVAYKGEIAAIPAGERQERIYKSGINEATIESSLAQCLLTNIKGLTQWGRVADLEQLRGRLQAIAAKLKPEDPNLKILRSDISTVSNRIEYVRTH